MKTPAVTITLDGEDAAVIGKQLRMLAHIQRSPDLTVAERMRRVGDQLYAAADAAGVIRK